MDHPVALTAPLIVDDEVIIGLYCEPIGSACISIDIHKFIEIKHFLYDPKWFRLLVHGIKRIWENHGIGNLNTHTHVIADTEMMAYLLDSGRDETEYSLSHLAHRYLQFNYPVRAEEICDTSYPESMYQIITYDAFLIAQLAAVLLEKMDADLKFAYFYGDLKIALILNEMSRYGIPVDGQAAISAYRDTVVHMNRLADEITGGRDFKLWTGSDVYRILQERKTNFPSRAIVRRKEVTHNDLRKIALSDPVAAKILEWRDLQTDLNFLKQAAGKSRIHPRWNIMTKTSRITASNPAVQNVNKVSFRPLMRPGPGWVMIKADYRQIQMRILANLSNDPELVRAFRGGLDVHQLTVEMCGIQGGTDKEKRDKAKVVNYGILFQMTADGLSREVGTDLKTAHGYIKAFWAKYSVAKDYLDRFAKTLKSQAPEERIVTSHLGRIRRFDGEFSATEQRRAKATLLQQMEADILRMAVMRLYAKFRNLGMKSRIVMIIHDAIWVEAPIEEAERARTLMEDTMQDAVEFPLVPLEVDFK